MREKKMRTKLLKLLRSAPYIEGKVSFETLVDHLLANGVTIGKDNNVPGKWIPVTERLPEVDGYYLCCVRSCLFPDRTYLNILACDEHGFQEGSIYTDNVTHWLPLPEPPKEGEE